MVKLNGLWIGKLGNANSWYHIYPFATAPSTEKIFVVRHSPPFNEIPNTSIITYTAGNPIQEFIKLYWQGRKIIRKQSINYIITFNPYFWGLAAWLLAKRYNIPISVGLIGKDFDKGLKKSVVGKILIRVLQKSEMITITGNAMRGYLEKKGIASEKTIIYPHCVRDEWFNTDDLPSTEFDLITVCELIERKRVEDIIKAVDLLHQRGKTIRVCILGDGPLRAGLEELVRELNLEEMIQFTGFQKQVLSYLKRSRIYVQASRSEGLSISLIEAMAAGLVPVSTVAGSEEDIIESGKNGFLIEVGKPEQMADAIEKLLDSKTYALFRDAVLRSKHHFTINRAVETAEKMIQQLTGIIQ